MDDDVNDVLSARLNVEGIFVLKVAPNGPATAAGLRAARIERGRERSSSIRSSYVDLDPAWLRVLGLGNA
jgi:hypothetical protein